MQSNCKRRSWTHGTTEYPKNSIKYQYKIGECIRSSGDWRDLHACLAAWVEVRLRQMAEVACEGVLQRMHWNLLAYALRGPAWFAEALWIEGNCKALHRWRIAKAAVIVFDWLHLMANMTRSGLLRAEVPNHERRRLMLFLFFWDDMHEYSLRWWLDFFFNFILF